MQLHRIVVVDDHAIVRRGIEAMLSREPDMLIVGGATTGEEALALLANVQADVVIADTRLPDMAGIQLCREIRRRQLAAHVVMLSAFLEEHAVEAALSAGAHAFVVKDVESVQLTNAIRAATQGLITVDPRAADRFAHWAIRAQPKLNGKLRPSLARVLALLADGLPDREIASTLGLSHHTVRSYLRELYRVLEVHSRTEATSVAVRRGLL